MDREDMSYNSLHGSLYNVFRMLIGSRPNNYYMV